MNDNKQIEEMAQDIKASLRVHLGKTILYPYIAQDLYACGYRKPQENEVRLTMEELKSIKKNEYRRGKTQQCWDIKNSTRKETAKKVLKAVFKHITTLEVWEKLQRDTWLSAGGNFIANKHIWDLLLEPIARQFGVEVEE